METSGTAFAAMFTFLAINGVEITADADQAWAFLSRLYREGDLEFAALDAWIRDNTTPRK